LTCEKAIVSSKSKANHSSGAPRWTYALAAIVGALGLLWTIASTFIAKPEASRPMAASVPGVSVSGQGSVGVGAMSGGTITMGNPPKAENAVTPAAAASR